MQWLLFSTSISYNGVRHSQILILLLEIMM